MIWHKIMLFLLRVLSEGHMQGHVWRKRIGVYPYCNKREAYNQHGKKGKMK